MKKRLRKALLVAGTTVLTLVLLAAAAVLVLVFDKSLVRNYVQKQASRRSGACVTIDRLDYGFFPLTVMAEGIRVRMDGPRSATELRVERLEAESSFRSLLRGQGPLARSLKLSRARLEFSQSGEGPPGEPRDLRQDLRDLIAVLARLGTVTVDDSSLRVGLPLGEINVTGLRLELGETGAVGGLSFSAGGDSIVVRGRGDAARLETRFEVRGTLAAGDDPAVSGRISLAGMDLRVTEPVFQWMSGDFTLGADFRADAAGIRVAGWEASAPGLVSAAGSLDARPEAGILDARAESEVENLRSALDIARPWLPAGLDGLRLDGRARAEIRLSGGFREGGGEPVLGGVLRLSRVRAASRLDGLSASGQLSGEVRIDGSPRKLEAGGSLELRNGSLSAKTFSVTDLSLGLTFVRQGNRIRVMGLRGSAGTIRTAAAGRDLDWEGVTFSGRGEADLSLRRLRMPGLEIGVPGLGLLEAAGWADWVPDGAVEADVQGSNLPLSSLLSRFSFLVPAAAVEWGPDGRLDAILRLRKAAGPSGFSVAGECSLADLSFQDPSGSLIADSLQPRLTFDVQAERGKPVFSGSVGLDLSRGEMLWRDVYVDWAQRPLLLSARGRIDVDERSLTGLELDASLDPLGSLRVSGWAGLRPQTRFDLRIDTPGIDVGDLLSQAASQAGPAGSWDVGITASAAVRVREEGAGLSARGRVTVQGGTLRRRDGTAEVAGLEADLPFFLSSGGKGSLVSFDFEKGFLSVSGIRTPMVGFGPVRIEIAAAPNLLLAGPLSLDLWESRLLIGMSALSFSPAASLFRGFSHLSLRGLDLSRLPLNSPHAALKGHVDADLGRTEFDLRRIVTEGQARAEIFGGRVTMSRIRVENPFSPGRVISGDIDAAGLNLEKLTDSVPFGRVTGIVDVIISGLALSYGQPESFVMNIESVSRKGVSRKFSLKAVNDLTVISSGGKPPVPPGGFLTKIVNSFGYDRIGIFCALKTDVFTLRGTIIEGGTEYLVRRSRLFGIDVVNRSPNNRISFKDMLGRLKRIGQSGESR